MTKNLRDLRKQSSVLSANVFYQCFISQWTKRSKHGLLVFLPKKTLIWRRHCSIGQSFCSMTSKQFLESSSCMKFFQLSIHLTNQKRHTFVSVRQANQIALFPLICCFCFVCAIFISRSYENRSIEGVKKDMDQL